MYSAFVYVFCAIVSAWASHRFYLVWRRHRYAPYWEFSAFFAVLAFSFITPLLFFVSDSLGALGGELITFFALLSFAFVFRAFVRFQHITWISPDTITGGVTGVAFLKFIWSLSFVPSDPLLVGNIIYWYYPAPNAVVYGMLLLSLTAAMGATILFHARNIRAHKSSIFFLGTAFLTGGCGGTLIMNFNTFGPLFAGYTLLLSTFVLVLLFFLTLPGEKSR